MANKLLFDKQAVIVYSKHMGKIKFTSKADKFKWGTRAAKRKAVELEKKMKEDRAK